MSKTDRELARDAERVERDGPLTCAEIEESETIEIQLGCHEDAMVRWYLRRAVAEIKKRRALDALPAETGAGQPDDKRTYYLSLADACARTFRGDDDPTMTELMAVAISIRDDLKALAAAVRGR